MIANPDDSTATLDAPRVSGWRAWSYLVWLCILRQARTRQMIWIAFGLLVLGLAVVGLNTLGERWGMSQWRSPRRYGPTFESWLQIVEAVPTAPAASAIQNAFVAAGSIGLAQSGFYVFANWAIFTIFLSFLLPIWSLSFATDALGGEREGRTLIWLLNQPMRREFIYLAKFVALLPFSLGFNVGGFALICLAAGKAGTPALRLFWPAVALSTVAFCALFHLMGALVRRPAVVAIVYSFFLETVLGNLPGKMKQVSIGFYARCMMFEAAQGYGIQPEKPSIYMPVDATTAQIVLTSGTILLLLIGTMVFSRLEYRDVSPG
jgi:ABC-type transport system involved in multi-copper enzyme maturation permease subunit